jgi:hypothetical protein
VRGDDEVKTKTVEEHMESLRPRMTGDSVDWAYVLGVVGFYANESGDPEVRLQNIQNAIKAFDRLRAERQGQIVEADLDEIREVNNR